MTKQYSQDKNLTIWRTKRAFKVKYKAFFIIFKGLSIAKNGLSPENAPLNITRFLIIGCRFSYLTFLLFFVNFILQIKVSSSGLTTEINILLDSQALVLKDYSNCF